MRDGRIWIDRGGLVKSVDVRVVATGRGSDATETLGGTLAARRGSKVRLQVTIEAQDVRNWSHSRLASTAPNSSAAASSRSSHAATTTSLPSPDTKVVRKWDASRRDGCVMLSHDLGTHDETFHVRLCRIDGNRSQPGHRGAATDPQGPPSTSSATRGSTCGSARTRSGSSRPDGAAAVLLRRAVLVGRARRGTLVAVDAGCTSVAAAEQLLHDLEEPLRAEAPLATTYFAGGPVVEGG